MKFTWTGPSEYRADLDTLLQFAALLLQAGYPWHIPEIIGGCGVYGVEVSYTGLTFYSEDEDEVLFVPREQG